MTRFSITLDFGYKRLTQFCVWCYTWKQANQHARNLASFHHAQVVTVEEI